MSALRCSGCRALFVGSSTLKVDAACTLCGATLKERTDPAQLHLCHAIDCITTVKPKLLFCFRHWRMVPSDVQTAVWCAYKPGQEVRKDPSGRYLLVQAIAVAGVAAIERKFTPTQVSEFVRAKAEFLFAAHAIDCNDIEYVMRVLNRGELKAVAAC